MASTSLVVDRGSIPTSLLEWLEAEEGKTGILLYREENGQIVFERVENADLELIRWLRINMERYHSVLERLADS